MGKMIHEKRFDLIINCPGNKAPITKETCGYLMRRLAVDRGVQLITNLKLAQAFVQAMEHFKLVGVDAGDMPVRSWKDHVVLGHRIEMTEHKLLPVAKRARRHHSSTISPFSPLLGR